jgi:hypothetical protein
MLFGLFRHPFLEGNGPLKHPVGCGVVFEGLVAPLPWSHVAEAGASPTVTVAAGDSVSAAVSAAPAGALILISPGECVPESPDITPTTIGIPETLMKTYSLFEIALMTLYSLFKP